MMVNKPDKGPTLMELMGKALNNRPNYDTDLLLTRSLTVFLGPKTVLFCSEVASGSCLSFVFEVEVQRS